MLIYFWILILFADINECNGENNCDDNASCIDTVGSYDCVCKDGYSGNGTHCDGIENIIFYFMSILIFLFVADVDECAQGICGANSICDNTIGSYTCGCQDGFEMFVGICIGSIINQFCTISLLTKYFRS